MGSFTSQINQLNNQAFKAAKDIALKSLQIYQETKKDPLNSPVTKIALYCFLFFPLFKEVSRPLQFTAGVLTNLIAEPFLEKTIDILDRKRAMNRSDKRIMKMNALDVPIILLGQLAFTKKARGIDFAIGFTAAQIFRVSVERLWRCPNFIST